MAEGHSCYVNCSVLEIETSAIYDYQFSSLNSTVLHHSKNCHEHAKGQLEGCSDFAKSSSDLHGDHSLRNKYIVTIAVIFNTTMNLINIGNHTVLSAIWE